MRRITFVGPDLETFAWSGPAAHVKLVFPDPLTGVLPELSSSTPPSSVRTYTPRRFDPETKQLQIDFFLHGTGIGSTWAERAQVGEQIVVFGPSPGFEFDRTADWYVLACDETALPAIETLLEACPPHIAVTLFAEIGSASERRTVAGLAIDDVHWVVRGGSHRSLAVALEAYEWPHGNGRVYAGCEAGMVREIRRYALDTLGFDRSHVTTRGYWRFGDVNHPDHDYAE
jgi:NADPH-dependent ferric siderophore reductase